MVKLAGLLPALTTRQGLPASAGVTVTRSLRPAGLVNTAGRGPGAAEMTNWDAANLLLATTCSDQAKDAATAVQRYRALFLDAANVWTKEVREPHPDRPGMDRVTIENLCPEPMQWLGETAQGLLLGDALDRLIGTARTGELQALFREMVITQGVPEDAIDRAINDLGTVYLKLDFRRPRPGGTITFGVSGARPYLSVEFGHLSELETVEELDALQTGDRTETVTVTHRTIFALGEALRQ